MKPSDHVQVRRLKPVVLQQDKSVIADDLLTLTREFGWAEDELRATLTARIYAEDAGIFSYKEPKTKLDLFKLAVFPQWLLRKFPANHVTKTVSFKALFPEYVPPKKFGKMVEYFEFYSIDELGPLEDYDD